MSQLWGVYILKPFLYLYRPNLYICLKLSVSAIKWYLTTIFFTVVIVFLYISSTLVWPLKVCIGLFNEKSNGGRVVEFIYTFSELVISDQHPC